jgi:hypothetical protein
MTFLNDYPFPNPIRIDIHIDGDHFSRLAVDMLSWDKLKYK